MRAHHVAYRAGVLLLALLMLCACGKKGRLYIPSEEESAVEPSARLATTVPLRH